MHQYLKEISQINDQLPQLIESMEWDEMLALTNQRDQLLRKYFEMSPLPDDDSIISKVMADMKNSDQQITEIIAVNKSKLVSESLSLKKSHRAISHYQSTQNHSSLLG